MRLCFSDSSGSSELGWRTVAGLSRIALTLAVLFAAGVLTTSRLPAQESHSSPNSSSASSSSSATQEAAHPSEEAAGKKEAKEANETDSLKHSGPVRFIARLTGLSLDHAYWLCVILNFAIVFGAVGAALRKKLPGIFRGRTESIQKRIEEARKTSEEARRRMTEVEGRLSRLDVEITEMRREAGENARAEEKRVLTEAEEERRRIVAAAEQEIALAAGAARRDLKAYAAELAVDLASKKIQVGKDADQALVREFTSQLGKDGN